jgi:ribosomal protein S27AE
MIGIPVLILIIIGGAYSQGFFDNAFESRIAEEPIESETESIDKVVSSSEINSKCGPGTILKDGECVLESGVDSKDKVISDSETNSKCGAGTIFDTETNSCVLDK